jgi:hypothetical protein
MGVLGGIVIIVFLLLECEVDELVLVEGARQWYSWNFRFDRSGSIVEVKIICDTAEANKREIQRGIPHRLAGIGF